MIVPYPTTVPRIPSKAVCGEAVEPKALDRLRFAKLYLVSCDLMSNIRRDNRGKILWLLLLADLWVGLEPRF